MHDLPTKSPQQNSSPPRLNQGSVEQRVACWNSAGVQGLLGEQRRGS